MKTSWILFAIAALFVCTGCPSGDDDDDDDADPVLPAGTYTTFNAGLAYGYVLYADERQPLIGAALADLGSDLICGQEIWYPEDAQAVIADAGMSANYWEDMTETGGDGPPDCTAEEADPLYACAVEMCGDLPPEELSGCVPVECIDEFTALSPDCVNCLIAQLGNTMEEMFEACVFGDGGSYAYDGTNGLLVLTNWTLSDTASTTFESTFNRRAALFARVEDGEGNKAAVACTHLTAAFDNVPYPGEGTWEEEQATQISEMLTWIDGQLAEGEPVVLMGDMNNGPAVGDVAGDLEANYAMFTDAGFSNPYADGGDAACTFCPDNPINDTSTGVLIDHVLVRDLTEGTTAAGARVLDGAIELTVDDEPVEAALSDHYGVTVTLSR